MARFKEWRPDDTRRRSAREAALDPATQELAGASRAPEVLWLQRTAGNQAVARVLADRRQLRRSTQDVVMNLGGEGSGDKRKRDDSQDGNSGGSVPEAKQTKQETVGDYTKDTDLPAFDRWMHASGKWHFSYFKATGDYHLKGNSGIAATYQKGFFGGQFKTVTKKGNKNATVPTINTGAAEYTACVTLIVPLYQALPNYRGQQF
jgi:hypothetical protein